MSQLGVGKEVLSHCGKCKLALAHTIVTMADETTAGRVQCKTCDATHKYKDPTKVKAKKKTTRRTKKEPAIPVSEQWEKAISASDKPEQNYTIRLKLVQGDVINHPKFGQGYVESVIDNNKVNILFKNEFKILVHNIS